jgi:hypothetical protein
VRQVFHLEVDEAVIVSLPKSAPQLTVGDGSITGKRRWASWRKWERTIIEREVSERARPFHFVE